MITLNSHPPIAGGISHRLITCRVFRGPKPVGRIGSQRKNNRGGWGNRYGQSFKLAGPSFYTETHDKALLGLREEAVGGESYHTDRKRRWMVRMERPANAGASLSDKIGSNITSRSCSRFINGTQNSHPRPSQLSWQINGVKFPKTPVAGTIDETSQNSPRISLGADLIP